MATLALGGCVRLSFVLGSGFLRSVGYSRGQKLCNGASRNTRCISRHRRDPGTCRFPTRPTGQRASLTGPRSSGAERRPLQRNAWNKRRRTTGRENTAAAGLGGGSAREASPGRRDVSRAPHGAHPRRKERRAQRPAGQEEAGVAGPLRGSVWSIRVSWR